MPWICRRKWTPEAKKKHKRDLKAKKKERAAAPAAVVVCAPVKESGSGVMLHAVGTYGDELEGVSSTGNGEALRLHSTEMHNSTLCALHTVEDVDRGAPVQFLYNQDWMLDKFLFQKVVRKVKREFDIDLFASEDGSNAFCSEFCFANGRSVYDEDYRGKCVYANPAFNQLFLFLVHYLITKVQDWQTSGVCVMPEWQKKPWWPLVMHFRRLCRWKKGSQLFTAPPLQPGGARRLVGPTRWPVLVLYDEAGTGSAEVAFLLLKAMCFDTVDARLQFSCEDARAMLVCAAKQKFLLLLNSFHEMKCLPIRTIYQF